MNCSKLKVQLCPLIFILHGQKDVKYHISKYSFPVDMLQKQYPRHISLTSLKHHPVLLIGFHYPHLGVPTEPVRVGPSGGPVAVCTALGWAVQGPASPLTSSQAIHPQQSLFIVLQPCIRSSQRALHVAHAVLSTQCVIYMLCYLHVAHVVLSTCSQCCVIYMLCDINADIYKGCVM